MKTSYKDMSKLVYPFYIILHPIDGFNEMKFNKKGSLAIANTIVIVWFFAEICRRQLTDFAFNPFRPDKFNVFYVMLLTFIIFFIAVVANWCFCTLLDGKGKFADIWVAGSYALLPMIIGIILYTVLSKFMVLDEGVFLTYLVWIANLWSAWLVVVALEVTHEYTLKKTLFSIFLTVLGMLIILFLAILIFSLYSQVVTFVRSIYNELLYRI